MITKELYKIEKGKITKEGHTMFKKDIVSDLNGWRNSARDFRNMNAELLHKIGELTYPKEATLSESSTKKVVK